MDFFILAVRPIKVYQQFNLFHFKVSFMDKNIKHLNNGDTNRNPSQYLCPVVCCQSNMAVLQQVFDGA